MLALGCAPDTIAWDGGEDVVRTALVERTPGPPGWNHTRLFLSNGEFPCGLPTFADPADQREALVALLAAACREDARHVRIDAWSPAAEDPAGVYPADARASAGDPLAIERFARGAYVGIDEAASSASTSLEPDYVVVRRTYWPVLGAPGEVALDHVETARVVGRFAFEEAHVSGTFDATTCEGPAGGTSLLGLLDAWGGDPTLLCTF